MHRVIVPIQSLYYKRSSVSSVFCINCQELVKKIVFRGFGGPIAARRLGRLAGEACCRRRHDDCFNSIYGPFGSARSA